MSEYSIGLDLGGTNLRAAAIDRDGLLLEKVAGSTNYAEGRQAIIDDMVGSIEKLRASIGPEGLTGIGVVAPGFIDIRKGVVANINNVPCLEGVPLRDVLEQRLGAHVVLDNDANAAALGERWLGAARGVDDLVLLTIGTGVGGGIISKGSVLHGFMGMAGEIGHTTVVPSGNPCGCGSRGCLEKHASGQAISVMARQCGLGDFLTAEQVYHLAVAGNELAINIFTVVGEILGIALATMINIFNFPLFAPPMMEEIRRRSFTFRGSNTRVEKATLGSEAGLYGAAYLPYMESR